MAGVVAPTAQSRPCEVSSVAFMLRFFKGLIRTLGKESVEAS